MVENAQAEDYKIITTVTVRVVLQDKTVKLR